MFSLKLLLVFIFISKEPYLFMIARVKTPKVKLFFQMQTEIAVLSFTVYVPYVRIHAV